MEEKIAYFEQPGSVNTSDLLTLVRERAQARGIAKIVLASTRGDTARAVAAALQRCPAPQRSGLQAAGAGDGAAVAIGVRYALP